MTHSRRSPSSPAHRCPCPAPLAIAACTGGGATATTLKTSSAATISSRPSTHRGGSSSSRPGYPATAEPAPAASSGIPQSKGGDGDLDNNGFRSDGDGDI
jgi:hypothetical protein